MMIIGKIIITIIIIIIIIIVEKYQELKREIGRLWKLRRIEVLPIVIGALGSVTKEKLTAIATV